MNIRTIKRVIKVILLKTIALIILLIIGLLLTFSSERYVLEKKRKEANPIAEKYLYSIKDNILRPVRSISTLKDSVLLFYSYENNSDSEYLPWHGKTNSIWFDTNKVEILEVYPNDIVLIRNRSRIKVEYVSIFCLHDTLPSSLR